MTGNGLIGIGIGIGCDAPFGMLSMGGRWALGLDSAPAALRFSISSNSSIVGKVCWNSETLVELNGDAGVIFGESEVEDTGDGGPKLEAGTSVCGVDTTGMDASCAGVITEVWRDSRLKCLAGTGAIGEDGSCPGGNEVDDTDVG
jgi:hypothetical protein